VISAFELAWLQLWREKLRLGVAVAGVAFAVVLIFMQIGFQDALFSSAVLIHQHLRGDLFMIHPHSAYIAVSRPFPRRRLYQALAFDGVAAVTPLYTNLLLWKNPETGESRRIFAIGFDPSRQAFELPGMEAWRERLREPDVIVYDELSRPEFGPIPTRVREHGAFVNQLGEREVSVRGLYRLGTSFGIDGSVITSDLTFLRAVPGWPPGAITIGVIQLQSTANARRVRDAMAASLPPDVLVLTRQQYLDHEVHYWASATPIGYVFKFGVAMGLVVGSIIVYQILFADIGDHLTEYATLKAMGYRNRFLVAVVLSEGMILTLGGYFPGFGLCYWLYGITESATKLPMRLSAERGALVFALTAGMCMVSGLIAMRKLHAANPAEIF
jgi:putative ABC transport system permease protein